MQQAHTSSPTKTTFDKEHKDLKFMTPLSVLSTVYVTDLPRTTSYFDLSEIFEKGIGPCSIQIKR